MKSNVCKIDKGIKDLDAIFAECEKVAVYNELTHKQSLQLRLLCEEADGMLPNIVDDFDGDLWFEFEDGICKVNITFELTQFSAEKKDELLKIAKNQKNAAAVGIVGKIRSAIEDFFLNDENLQNLAMSTTQVPAKTVEDGYYYMWSLETYRNDVKKTESADDWDELEKSVLASVADDVIVSVKGKEVSIVIVKKFA